MKNPVNNKKLIWAGRFYKSKETKFHIMNCSLSPESRKTVDFCHADLNAEVLLELKQGPGLSPSNQDTQLPVLLQPGPYTQLASLHLGWIQLPSAEPLGCREIGAVPSFSSSTLGLPCGSCPALSPGTGTWCNVNCCPTQFFTSAIYIRPVTTQIIRASAAWWSSLRPADFLFNWTVLFSASDRIPFCMRSHYTPAEFGMIYPRKTREHALCFRDRI